MLRSVTSLRRTLFTFSREANGTLFRIQIGNETTLKRGNDKNVMALEQIQQFDTQVLRAGQDRRTRLIVLESGVPNVFSAGLDARELTSAVDVERKMQTFHAMLTALRRILISPVPSVALVDGPAHAAGAMLALGCDLRFLTPQAKVSFSEVKFGLPLWAPVYDLLRFSLNDTRALFDITVLGDMLDQKDLDGVGFGKAVDSIADAEELMQQYRRKLVRLPRDVVAGTLAARQASVKLQMDEVIHVIGNPTSAAHRRFRNYLTDEFLNEGAQAYLDQRQPSWVRIADEIEAGERE